MKRYFIVPFLLILPTVAFAQAFDADLYFGIRSNDEVFQLQEFLADQGFYQGPITGNFFSLTLTAVKKFQVVNKITPASGYFGSKTRAKANGILSQSGITNTAVRNEEGVAAQTASPAPSKKNADIIGSLLEQIKLLQQQIIALQQRISAPPATALAVAALPAASATPIASTPVAPSIPATSPQQTVPPPVSAPDTTAPQFIVGPTLTYNSSAPEFRLVFTADEPVVFVPQKSSANPTDGAGNCLSVYTTPCSFRIDRFAQFCGAEFELYKTFSCHVTIQDIKWNKTETVVSFREPPVSQVPTPVSLSPSPTPPPQPVDLNSDLVGYWKFDEGQGTLATDSSNYDNHGVLSSEKWVTGKFGYALSFDGSGGVDIGDRGTLERFANLSISLWIQATTSQVGVLVNKYENGSNNGYYLALGNRFNPSTQVTFLVDEFGEDRIVSNQSITDGQWHHIVAIYQGGVGPKLYIDGVQGGGSREGKTLNSVGTAPGKSFKIGTYSPGGYPEFNFRGVIDDVRIYNSVLNPAEILQLHTAQ